VYRVSPCDSAALMQRPLSQGFVSPESTPEPSALVYRPDVDGLRAVAVLSVIGFHASAGWFPGGYVGVDIFFVISGFLITSIICRQLDEGRFSFVDFYARRCKRIFPALIIVLIAVLAFGWIFLLTDEYQRLGKHVAAGAGFISNIALWRESGYFDKSAETKPLLHLWSLGIEEQFYLLWPPLLVWLWKRKSDLLVVTVAILSVSFVTNVMLISLWQAGDMYYLPPTRFWELMVGGAFAYAHIFRKEQLDTFLTRVRAAIPYSAFISLENIQATIGLSLILLSVFGLTKTALFPGWWALLPTIGALLLISAGPAAWINRKVLANRSMVFIGLISYPLYLWHWPLLSYAQIIAAGVPPLTTRVSAVSAAFLLAWLTYRIVEKPIRTQRNPAALILVATLSAVACVGIAAFADRLHARSERYGLDNIFRAAAASWGFPGPNLVSVHTAFGYHWVRGRGPHKVLFFGDSHMEQYYPRIDRLLTEHPDRTKGIFFVTKPSCPPIREISGFTKPSCVGLVENAFSIAKFREVDTVVIAAAWNRYDVFESKERDAAFRDLQATITGFRKMGRRVYLILPTPRGESFDPAHLVKRSLLNLGFVVQEQVERADVDRNINPVATRLMDIAHSAGATAIDPVDYLCGEARCPTLAEDRLPVYTDDSHLRPAYVREHMTFLDRIVSTSQPN